MNHCTLANNEYGIHIYDQASLTITDSLIENHSGPGIDTATWTTSYILNLSNSTIRNNAGAGISLYGLGTVDIVGNRIYLNGGYGIFNGNTAVIFDARYNWWGSNSGPAPYGSGNGINYAACWDAEHGVYYICDYYVDADPWLGKEVSTGAQLGDSGPLSSVQAIIADPVNTANGNYAHQHTDIAIPTRGLPLDITHAYNSLSPQAGPLGYNWMHNWNLTLTEDATGGSVTIAFGDGHSEHWTWTGAAYDGRPGVFGILVKNGDGSFDLLQKDQTKYHFDAAAGPPREVMMHVRLGAIQITVVSM